MADRAERWLRDRHHEAIMRLRRGTDHFRALKGEPCAIVIGVAGVQPKPRNADSFPSRSTE
jgi:hypothetical protein